MSNAITRKTWEEFQDAGMLWFVNRIIHVFGWSVVVATDGKGDFVDAYPARVKFRGFPETSEVLGFHNVTQFVKNNIGSLIAEVEE